MNRSSRILKWSICTVLLMLLLRGTEGFVGINWGRKSSQRLVPTVIVDLLMEIGIKDLRVFSSGNVIGLPFANTGIALSITFRNDNFNQVNNSKDARGWIETCVTSKQRQNVTVRYLMVGGNPLMKSGGHSRKTVEILRQLSEALDDAGHVNVKASIPHHTDVMKPVKVPSECDFLDEIKDNMLQALDTLKKHKAPFVLDIAPIHTVKEMNWDPEFAFFDNKSNFTIVDNGTVYKNAVEFWYDACLWALRKAGAGDLKIVLGKVGWPTDGFPGATDGGASRFYAGFLPFVHSKKGTPLRSGPIDVFLQQFVDENMVALSRSPSQRHYGIYRADGYPKYPIDFSGQGRPGVLPANANGILAMPSRWCVFDGNNDDPDLVKKSFDFACSKSDCSKLADGGSCRSLNASHTVSFAFNMYFQMQGQKTSSCSFDGLARIVLDDPSTPECVFNIEITSADMVDSGQAMKLTEKEFSGVTSIHVSNLTILFMLLITLWINTGGYF